MLEHLREFAVSERQREVLEVVIKEGSNNKASIALGVGRRVVDKIINRIKKQAAIQGFSPEHDMTRTVPDAYVVKGVSTYYNKDGKPSGQWVKSSLDNERRQELIREAFEAMAEELPRLPPIDKPSDTYSELCNLYTFTDYHMGMLAWHKEGGADWDIKIAEKMLTDCFDVMVTNSPRAKIGFINQLGDFLHSDGMMPVTPTSGHILDQDGRFSKIVQTAIRVLRRIIDLALMKHEQVIVLMAEGNHDMASSIWLRAMFKALYENEPRVTVIDSELPYYHYEHGKTMLCFHHGHLSKNDALPLLFASQFAPVWGRTTKRYCHTGHRHHTEEKEHSGMTVIQHPTLSARDAYAARGGWISERQATSITYHTKYGQVARNTVTPEMIEA
jgi:hypothetical protein